MKKILVALLILTACGGEVEPVMSGTVVGRRYEPARVQYVYSCGSYDKNGLCTTPVNTPIFHSDSWYVMVCNDGGRCTEHMVVASTYDEVKIGQRWEAQK